MADAFLESGAFDSLVEDLTKAGGTGGRSPVMTLRVHGFNTTRHAFEAGLLDEADPALSGSQERRRRLGEGFNYSAVAFRPPDGVYVGFRWPSEGLATKGSLQDTALAVVMSPAVGLLMLIVPILCLAFFGHHQGGPNWLVETANGIGAAVAFLTHPLALVDRALQPRWADFWGLGLLTMVLGAFVILFLLRLSTYLRDRYRALHYGVPDLGEFMRTLEEQLVRRNCKISLNVIGHSMGALVVINALRVMSDYFYEPSTHEYNTIGREGTFRLKHLVLCAADVPTVMATPDHNNYFMSALRRFDAAHSFGNDHDVILKWLSGFANWMSEPRYDMAGQRLGNVLLIKHRGRRIARGDSRHDWKIWPVARPVFRHIDLFPSDPVGGAKPAVLDFYDCTLDARLNASHRAIILLGIAGTVASGAILLHGASSLGIAIWAAIATSFAWGPFARVLWRRGRDVPRVRGLVGWAADLPSLLAFLGPLRSNPHSGYFEVDGPSRARIAAILRSEPMTDVEAIAREPSEGDGVLRWKRVLISI